MYQLEQFKDKKFKRKFLITETLKWWLVLLLVYFILNLINMPAGQDFNTFITIFFELDRFFSVLFFCLIAAFFYSTIKLVTAKKNLKDNNK